MTKVVIEEYYDETGKLLSYTVTETHGKFSKPLHIAYDNWTTAYASDATTTYANDGVTAISSTVFAHRDH